MFEKRHCHFTHIFELFARTLYVIAVTVLSSCISMAGNMSQDEEFLDDMKGFFGNAVTSGNVVIFVGVGLVLVLSAIMLLYCTFKWRYTFVSAEENTLIYESGKFIKKRVAIPFDKINTIDMGRNLFERAVGTCRLKIDTGAYSNTQERKSAEMNLVFSLTEADEIRGYILNRAQTDDAAEEALTGKSPVVHQEPDWVIRAGAADFILYGLTSSSVWKLFWILVMGVFVIADLSTGLLKMLMEAVLPYAKSAADLVSGSGLIMLLLVLLVILLINVLITDLFTVVWAAIRFCDFRVAREGRNIIVRYGLITEKNYTLQVRNIHALIIKQNVFQQVIGRCSVEAVCMGFGDEQNETALLLPIIRKDKLNELLSVILPEYVAETQARPRNKAGIYFHIIKPTVIWSLICIIGCLLCLQFMQTAALPLSLSVIAVLLRMLNGILSYRNTAIDWNEKVVSVQSGGLNKSTYRIRTDAVQEVQLKTNLIKRHFGIGSYYVHYHGPQFNNTSVSGNISDQHFAELAAAVED